MKKLISALLAVAVTAMSAAALTGCSEQKISVEPGPFGRYSPSVKITYTLPFVGGYESSSLDALGYSVENTPWTEQIEKDLGIRLVNEWAVTDNSAYITKLTGAISVGEIPDIVNLLWGEDYAYGYLKSLYENELVTELDEIIEEYASEELKESIEVGGKEIFWPATFGGKIYGMPQITNGAAALDNIWWMRSDWLDAVGKSIPTDWDSFVDVLTAFTRQDPDGNNIDDTYGICTAVNAEHCDKVLFGSLGAYPYMWVDDGNGSLVYGSVLPEMKEALGKISELYKAGLVYPNLTGERYLGIMNNQAGIIDGTLLYVNAFSNLYTKNDGVAFAPVAAFPLNGDDSVVLQGNSNAFRFWVCSKTCKYPETMIKLFNHYIKISEDAQNDADLYDKLFTDIAGLAPVITSHLQRDPENTNEKLFEAIENRDPSELVTSAQKTTYDTVMKYLDGDRSAYGSWLVYARGGANDIFTNYSADNFTANKYSYSKTATMLTSENTLRNLEYATYNAIITGEKTLDEFDLFVKEWNDKGGAQITAEVNEWYSALNS